AATLANALHGHLGDSNTRVILSGQIPVRPGRQPLDDLTNQTLMRTDANTYQHTLDDVRVVLASGVFRGKVAGPVVQSELDGHRCGYGLFVSLPVGDGQLTGEQAVGHVDPRLAIERHFDDEIAAQVQHSTPLPCRPDPFIVYLQAGEALHGAATDHPHRPPEPFCQRTI